ncbi:hypothetical protein ACIRPX_33385 [Streptomyces sp. NPDC101225]|uniref:hypothetical protein n=1 Tax=Streptomyces sp. NPDC101225 TaxID=3366135 RepID=UPI0038246EEB
MNDPCGGAGFMVSTPAAEQCCMAVPEHAPPASVAVGAVAPDIPAEPADPADALLPPAEIGTAAWSMPAM